MVYFTVVLNKNLGSNNVRNFIVTTDLESTWPVNQPIVFLGGWCLRYSRKHIWTQLNYTLALYHWDQRTQITKDYLYINEVYEKLLIEVSLKLNNIHKVNYSIRYWRITIGYWLLYFTQIYFDRWQMMQSISRIYPDSSMYRLSKSKHLSPPVDTLNFINKIQESSWNEIIYADIAEKFTNIKVIAKQEDKVQQNINQLFAINQNNNLLKSKQRFRILRYFIGYFGRKEFFQGHGVSIQLDYLRMLEHIKLAILLRQLPIKSVKANKKNVFADISQRTWSLNIQKSDLFTEAIASEIPKHLPICFLEGYSELSKLAVNSGPIKNPKIIVTDNRFAHDDEWKLWAAYHCEKGSKLVIAQHGGYHGTGVLTSSESYEIKISDRYLSWGWEKSNEIKIVPAPAIKLISKRKRKLVNSGICLQVTMSNERQSGLLQNFPIASQFEEYLADQFEFVSALSNEVRKQLIVRLNTQDFNWDIKQRWQDEAPDIVTDPGNLDINYLMNQSRIYVATYNATTFLESFTRNIPTVIFWNPGYFEISEDAKPYFYMLKQASILFDNPVSCAKHLNLVWDDVIHWWTSPKVKKAVSTFINQYAYVGSKPIRELKMALIDW